MAQPQAPERSGATDIKRYLEFLKDETDGAALYRLLAEAESDPNLKIIFERMAASEDRHKALWERKLREAGHDVPRFKVSRRVKLLGWLARRFGTGAVSPIVTRMEVNAQAGYDHVPAAESAGLPAEERSHARLFREIGRTRASESAGQNIAMVEGRHRGGSGNALRAAVLGVNDGLVSSLSLVFGVAGASPGRSVVFLTGVAGLLAGSLSMALGEWISVRSSAESFERQMRIEKEELELLPEEEEAELALIYQAKGIGVEEARQLAHSIIANKETALDTLAREELGMSAGESGNAWVAAVTSFLLFAVGASLPVIPWAFFGGPSAAVTSGVLAGLGLFGAGALTTLFTGRGLLYSGARMLVFGLAAAAITFGVGRVIGVNVG